jgi:catechol 2,3-dioxygenase-like lactoylglutathione lyase family enzyme
MARLPGLKRIDELAMTGFRIHLMEVADTSMARDTAEFAVFQHACFAVDSTAELRRIRDLADEHRWAPDAGPTEIIVDDDGVESFYVKDPDALEWEITWIPAHAADR